MQTPTVAIEPQLLTAATATYYTVPEGTDPAVPVTAWIDKFTVLTTDGADHTVTVYLVPKGQTAGLSNVILNGFAVTNALYGKESYLAPGIVGKLLKSGDTIQAKADAAGDVQIACNVREVE